MKSIVTNISYSINFNRLIFDASPKKHRKVKFFQWLISTITPLKYVNNQLLQFVAQTRYELNINASTIVLERYLRNLYSNEAINIINASFEIDQIYLYRKNEIGDTTNDSYLYRPSESNTDQMYLSRKSETQISYDFKVQIPQSVLLTGVSIDSIESIIKKYATTRFIIEVV